MVDLPVVTALVVQEERLLPRPRFRWLLDIPGVLVEMGPLGF